MQELTTIIGLMAAVNASVLFYPQVWASFKSKNTASLSWLGIYTALANGFLWLTYGFLKLDPFIYVTNIVLLIGVFLLVLLKRKHG